VEQKERTLVGVSFGDAFRAQEFLTAATRLAANQRLTSLLASRRMLNASTLCSSSRAACLATCRTSGTGDKRLCIE
jgi:hypothetical protein